MGSEITLNLFLVLSTALVGGLAVRLLKLPPLIGYILAGIVGGGLLPISGGIQGLAEIGIILLLFSVGLELSFQKLIKTGHIAILGAILQIIFVTAILYFVLILLGFESASSIVLALSFSLSSTAVVVKILADRAETETIHGEIMIGWLLTQDLAVVPMFVLLPLLAINGHSPTSVGFSLISAVFLVFLVLILGKFLVPKATKFLALTNSKELLLLGGVVIAMGMAALSSFFNISASLGAFLAGLVISESQENHAIFSQTRPLRDLFVILFFVTLGFLVDPVEVYSHLGLIFLLTALVIIIKFIVVFTISSFFGYHGKTALMTALGLTQIGEFAFVIFISANKMNILSDELVSLGTSVVLLTIIITPLFYKLSIPFWRKVKNFSVFSGWNKNPQEKVDAPLFQNHIIICGFGRVGKWLGVGLASAKINYVAIDYNQKKVREARNDAINIIYGDPTEKEVLDMASVKTARAIIIALPDQVAQEEIIAYAQTVNSDIKIYVRASLDEEFRKLKNFKVKKIVQPEFEASITILKSILLNLGKSNDEVSDRILSLRKSHSARI